MHAIAPPELPTLPVSCLPSASSLSTAPASLPTASSIARLDPAPATAQPHPSRAQIALCALGALASAALFFWLILRPEAGWLRETFALWSLVAAIACLTRLGDQLAARGKVI